MARKVILENGYVFTPSTKTLVLPRYVPQERLILITNVTTNQVIYNFSDPSLKANTYTTTASGASSGTTTLVLNFNTTAMSATDKISIVVDDYAEKFEPAETLLDPTNKLRVTTPQALIDTDFEYGNQITKWENLALTNNRPYAYAIPTQLPNVTAIAMNTSSKTVTLTVTTSTSTPNAVASATPSTGYATYTTAAANTFSAGQYVTILGSSIAGYNGTYLIVQKTSNTTFTVANTTTGTPTWSTASAIGGVAPVNGTPITVQDSYLTIANGNFVIESGGGTGAPVYTARAVNTSSITSLFDSNKTNVFVGTPYTAAAIGGTPTLAFSGTAITVTTTVPHGLSIGNEIAVTGVTASTNAPNGSFVVATINSPTQFVYYAAAAPTGTLAAGTIFVRPQAMFYHRPLDGGVIFSSNGTSNFETATRQTRRYFRYQSGKGIQVSSGTILKPNLQIDSLTSSGTTVTVQTKEQHNIQPGTSITISGAVESEYNGTFTVTSITSYNGFQYTALTTPSASPASGTYYVGVNSWYGASNRLGMFDAQNGLFFEFNGTTLYAVKRNSTFQLSGKVTVTNGSNTVTQTNAAFPTFFSKQTYPGDFIVLRGQSYRVSDIASDTSLTITPSYRGANAQYVLISETIDQKIPQSEWNLDKCDGTGPSGYNLDLSKMQMFYIDYSWYGAGFIRWGLRTISGNVIYVHKMANNNINTEAYMRSGNLPARYESITIPPVTTITTSIASGDSTINAKSTLGFPEAGTLVIRDASNYEYINYTSKTLTTFTGLTRGKAGSASLAITIASGSNTGTVSSTTGLQVGQRIISSAVPDGTFISSIVGTTLTLSNAVTSANPTVIVPPMGRTSGQAFTYSATAPVAIEYAFPSFAPSVSHWGTSVIMDGRYDDDKSLVFTYGQTTFTSIAAGATKALFSIRVSPSADNGLPSAFGGRELVNRMQLVLRTLDLTTKTASSNLLVKAVLNGSPSSATTWTNAVGDVLGTVNSSLSQIADYAGGNTNVYGGEVTAGFFVNQTTSIELDKVRDLGNSIMGGGSTNTTSGIYPDGPDVLTITVTNVGTATSDVLGRLSWTEAQA
jgi:hypothetical protein